MLTVEQRAVLKADIEASVDPAVVTALGGGVVGRDDTTLAAIYNADSAYVAWRSDTPKSGIFTALAWKSMTPIDVPDGTTLWTNRSLACQGKQFVLQTMLISAGTTLDMSDNSVRTGIKDAIQDLPSGIGGALQDAGWPTVKAVSIRFATRAEELFAIGGGTQGTPGKLVFQGTITINDIGTAFNG